MTTFGTDRAKQTTRARRRARRAEWLTDDAIERYEETQNFEYLQNDANRVARCASEGLAQSVGGTKKCHEYIRRAWAEMERMDSYVEKVINNA